MPVVFVDNKKDLSSALRKLKKMCSGFLSRSPKKDDRFHIKDSKKRRISKLAAKSREKKRTQRTNARLRKTKRR